jgi:arsenate reductase-like glutaredoxin family protein
MPFKKYLICIAAIGIFSACGGSDITSNDSLAIDSPVELPKYADLDVVTIDDPWNLEHLDLRLTKADEKPILLYYNGFESANSRDFEDRILSAELVFKILQENFTIFDIKTDDQRVHRIIKASGDTIKEPVSDWWKSYQIERYDVFESPFCDIVDFENTSFVKKQMNYADADTITFVKWLMEGLTDYRWEKLIKNKSVEAPLNDVSDFGRNKVHTQEEYDAVLAKSKVLNKPVLVQYKNHHITPYSEFENNVWLDSLVFPILKNKFIIASIYLNNATIIPNLSANDTVRTYGKFWRNYEMARYNITTQPLFDIVNHKNESIIETVATDVSHGDAELYRLWLGEGLSNFHQ